MLSITEQRVAFPAYSPVAKLPRQQSGHFACTSRNMLFRITDEADQGSRHLPGSSAEAWEQRRDRSGNRAPACAGAAVRCGSRGGPGRWHFQRPRCHQGSQRRPRPRGTSASGEPTLGECKHTSVPCCPLHQGYCRPIETIVVKLQAKVLRSVLWPSGVGTADRRV